MNIGIDLDGVLTNFNEFCMSYGTKYASEIGKGKIVNSKGYESIEIFRLGYANRHAILGKI